jgi:hypothetical protein
MEWRAASAVVDDDVRQQHLSGEHRAEAASKAATKTERVTRISATG